jgi:hypothetical protein
LEADSPDAQPFHRLDQLLHGPGQPIELPDNNRVTAPGIIKRFQQGGALCHSAGHLLDENFLASRFGKRVALQGQVLIQRRDSSTRLERSASCVLAGGATNHYICGARQAVTAYICWFV